MNTTDARYPAATRADALERLSAFVPLAGRTYAAKRNFDFGPGRHAHVSTLSPYIRHRLITEQEVIEAVLQSHTHAAAEKFIQEVCWRTYWKGWLEQRPGVWDAYCVERDDIRLQLRDDIALAAEVAAAERGDTGIACFDAWVRELAETGYLHNHARMWFASIWIFTLRLPWTLGADFFYRQLLDGDPASNTLSWRWVAGLHTRGKTYLARPDNIATYTEGRFAPSREELSSVATALPGTVDAPRVALAVAATPKPGSRALLLLTDEDLNPETWQLHGIDVAGVAILVPDVDAGSPSPLVRDFKWTARADATARAARRWGSTPIDVATPSELAAYAHQCRTTSCITSHVPVGPTRTALEPWVAECARQAMPLVQISRDWDRLFWPHATAGFFKLKERIPRILSELGISNS